METSINSLKEALKNAERVAVLTGAGVSAESGVPTFRGADGLWKNYQATELATPEAFAKDPELVWEFYNWRRGLIAQKACNPAHTALTALERLIPDFTLITQNVDGLHLLAGSRHVLEIHGNIWRARCTRCGKETMDRAPDMGRRPTCAACGGLLRPAVVWFGESLDPRILRQAIEAAQQCRIMLVVGTSSVVQPAASLAFTAKSGGAMLAEINLEKTPNSDLMDIVILGKAGEILPRLVEGWA
ncbi:MAG: NAD-dependent protein deacylase [Thermodesulfobacteriota bacterium]|nr:NAD-dependent protein deacylase [Thermodesulfobacteriota bacterium]